MLDRRVVLKGGALGGLVFIVGGAETVLSPREARAQAVPLSVLTPGEQETLESLGDVLLPGARDAGIAHFVDHQLGVPPGEALLLARLVNVAPPFANFYRAGLRALDEAASRSHGAPFARLADEVKIAFVDQIRQRPPEGWSGPPSPFFYYVVRNDAVDVVYGTVEGFEKLGIPYMPHIPPSAKW
ncbi:gluconate 2-dehydrogenase subunit 3 family protein [Bradyrhizobium sp. CCGUVB1N3]|uniref:gluconate 2-dehydrogenase subunit 3 family protein n=1 Tax=Bradyrhizobium sp. CCGUVB1N3 TaxID=2949629 RepID=UPI0020B310BD|nr:gluconate 2-dehydrogenase subunit 3 family protein [Bradyrhizobium sp. CCGUVB1N3]MCP3469057.1 gluconate 2-dehydrogenase subunit 3 family protein [Bradyrhizobium sp. CCGUVB1N3]